MSTRTTVTTVTFRRAFTLSALEGTHPAGTYRVITEEEQIPACHSPPSAARRPCCTCRPIPCPAARARS